MKSSNSRQSIACLFEANMNWTKLLCRAASVVVLGFLLPDQGRAQTQELVNPGFELTPSKVGWTVVGDTPIITVGTATYYNAGECPPDDPAELVSSYSGTNVGNIYVRGARQLGRRRVRRGRRVRGLMLRTKI
jgi:hypothetical protein